MCSVSSVLGVASSLVGNSESHCIGCCYSPCYCVHQVHWNCSLVVDWFAVCTYSSWSEQLGYFCEKNTVVANALLCYPHSHVGSTLFSSFDRSSVLSVPVRNSRLLPLSSMFRTGWELSGSSDSDESALLLSWLLRLAKWCFIALLRKGYCFLNRLGEAAADVLKGDSVSLASVLCAFALCLHFSMVMFLSADSLASAVNSSLAYCT